MDFLMNLLETFQTWRKSRMALPYLNTAAKYLESQLDRLPGDFEVEVDPGNEAVHYVYYFNDLKFNISLSTAPLPEPNRIHAAIRAAVLQGTGNAPIKIDLGSIVGMEPGHGLPTTILDDYLRPLYQATPLSE